MRSLLLLLAFSFLLAPAARAECPTEGVHVFPSPGAVVPTNTRFLLEGIGTSRDAVASLPGRKLRMQADDHEVAVRVQRGWKSAHGRVTVILTPAAPLKPNHTYVLRLDDVLPGIQVLNGRGAQATEWHTGKGKDLKPPRWLKRPSVSEGVSRRTKEGPERFIRLNMSLKEDSSIYLAVMLSPGGSGPTSQHYVVPVHNGVALVGHEACGGGFTLDEGKSYRARLEVFDAAGNLAPAIPPLQFEAPVAPQENP